MASEIDFNEVLNWHQQPGFARLQQAVIDWYDEDPVRWQKMAYGQFRLNKNHAHLLMVEGVLLRIQETNVQTESAQGTEHWIDPEGRYRIIL